MGLVSVPSAFAQINETQKREDFEIKFPSILPTNISITKQQLELKKAQKEAKEVREGMKLEVEATRREVKEKAEAVREITKKEIEITREAAKNQIEEIRETTKKNAEEAREAFKTEKEQILKMIPTNPQEAIKIFQERRDTFQKEAEAKKELLKINIDTLRAKTENIITTKTEELKLKLNQFKDERKKQVTEKVNNSLNEVNKNSVNRFTNNVNELDKAMVNIATRAEKASVAGKDTGAVMTALQNAKTAIETARNSITTQAAKAYSVTISTELKVGEDLKESRDLLSTDLKLVQDKIKAARDMVWVALGELQKVPNINKPIISTQTKESQQILPSTQ